MKYDYSKVSREALEELAKECVSINSRLHTVDVVREQAQVKTRAESDREIGNMLRHGTASDIRGVFTFTSHTSNLIRDLVNASRNAPEE